MSTESSKELKDSFSSTSMKDMLQLLYILSRLSTHHVCAILLDDTEFCSTFILVSKFPIAWRRVFFSPFSCPSITDSYTT